MRETLKNEIPTPLCKFVDYNFVGELIGKGEGLFRPS